MAFVQVSCKCRCMSCCIKPPKSKSIRSPLFDIQLPSNSSYVVTLEFSAPELSPSSRWESEFFSNPSSLRPTLTLVVESKSHHVFLFYLKVR